MYFHYILNKNENDMIFKSLKAQQRNPKKNNWCVNVKNDLKEFNINFSHEEIKNMSKDTLKILIRKKSRGKALEDLNKIKKNHIKR